jgi:hypothetical protein
VLYEQLSAKTRGLVGSVCAADYTSQLATIGQATMDAVGNVKLSCAPIANTMSISSLSGVVVDESSYSIVGDEIVFSKPLDVGKYNINYRCP